MFMSDDALRTLAYNRYSTLGEMIEGLKNRPWGFMEEYGLEVLDVLARLDRADREQREKQEREKQLERETLEYERWVEAQRKAAEKAVEKQREIAARQRVAEERRAAVTATKEAQRAAAAARVAEDRQRKAREKLTEEIQDYIRWLNQPQKRGRARKPPPAIEQYLNTHLNVLTEHGRSYYITRVETVSPLRARDLNLTPDRPTMYIPHYTPL
ncbi:hypothetical protein C8F01DRAFT_1292318 [Mycena amicta]|nr:hypothetical protein C8F01DRAFT_1292318 [Mycena amicta]